MNINICDKQQYWRNLCYHLSVNLEWLMKTTEGLNQTVEGLAKDPTWPLSNTSQDRFGIQF